MKSAHLERLSKRIAEISSNLWTDMNENEVEEQITFWVELVEIEKNIQTLSQSIEPVGSDKSQELKDAEGVYIQAKKEKARSLFGQNERWERKGWIQGEEYNYNPALVEQAEKEYEFLQNKILILLIIIFIY